MWYRGCYHNAVSKRTKSPREDARQAAEFDLDRVVQLLLRRFRPPAPERHSPAVFTTPWPRGSSELQKSEGGEAKPYQVDQVLSTYDKLVKEAVNG